MTSRHLLSLCFSLAFSAFGCAASTPVAPVAVMSADAVEGLSEEAKERALESMMRRCEGSVVEGQEAAQKYCVAANLARKEQTEAALSLR